MTVTILGAGFMGAAATYPLSARGHRVRLWGTWLDDALISAVRDRMPHPRLGTELPQEVAFFDSGELEAALHGANACFLAVTSEGFLPILNTLLEHLPAPLPLFSLTKGLVSVNGATRRLSDMGREMFRSRFPGVTPVWSAVGGPVKAAELAREVPTASVYGCAETEVAGTGATGMIKSFETEYYRLSVTDDVAGVELCAAYKNAYAVAMGVADGLYEQSRGNMYHNLKSLLFTQAVREIAAIVTAAGGRQETVFDLAGMGDLYVTAASGRNRELGYRIGQGDSAAVAYHEMLGAGRVAEGYHAVPLGAQFARETGLDLEQEAPLLRELEQLMAGSVDAETAISGQRFGASKG